MHISKKLSVVIIASLVVSGCETTGGNLLKTSDEDPCNPALGALIGGVLGAVASDKKGKGALIGAGLGTIACIAMNAVSRQTRTAEQVETEYRQQNAGKLPQTEPVVQTYNVTLNPGNEIHSGNKVKLVSNSTVVSATQQPVTQVKEVLTLVGPEGTRTAEKVANERPGSGAYENTFNLTFPKNVSPGIYPIKTKLYVNGKPKETRSQNLKIVADNGVILAAYIQ